MIKDEIIMNADETHKNVSSVPIAMKQQIGMMSVSKICKDDLKCLFLVFSSIVFSPYFCYNVVKLIGLGFTRKSINSL